MLLDFRDHDVKRISTTVNHHPVEMVELAMTLLQVTLVNVRLVIWVHRVKSTLMTACQIHVIVVSALMVIIPSHVNVIPVTLVHFVKLKLMNVNQILVNMVENVMISLVDIDVAACLVLQVRTVKLM